MQQKNKKCELLFRFPSFRFISVSFELECVLSCLARILMCEVPIKTFSFLSGVVYKKNAPTL
jgi:hypothetical protein